MFNNTLLKHRMILVCSGIFASIFVSSADPSHAGRKVRGTIENGSFRIIIEPRSLEDRMLKSLRATFVYHKKRGVPQFVSLNSRQKDAVLDHALALVMRQNRPVDTDTLIQGWEAVMGKNWNYAVKDQLTHVFDYHKRNGVQQVASLSDAQKDAVIQHAFNLVTAQKRPVDTDTLIQSWEAVIGKNWNYAVKDELTRVFDYHKGRGVRQVADLDDSQKDAVLQHAFNLVTTQGRPADNTNTLIESWEAVIGKNWNYAVKDQLTHVFDYHKRNGVQQVHSLNDGQKDAVLQHAFNLVTARNRPADTDALREGWEEVMGRSWNYDQLTNVFDYHKGRGVRQVADLDDAQKDAVIRRASNLVTTRKLPADTDALREGWEEVMGRSWN